MYNMLNHLRVGEHTLWREREFVTYWATEFLWAYIFVKKVFVYAISKFRFRGMPYYYFVQWIHYLEACG